MTIATSRPEAPPPPTALPERPPVLPLQPGDRLTRVEFERRWDAMPRLRSAELINGIVYMPSPLRHGFHGRPHAQLLGWLTCYVSLTPGMDPGDNSSDRLDEDNMPQPDALLRIPSEAGGRSGIADDGMLEGPPEFCAEVAASSASYDLHDKLAVYRRHGVREYLVWRVLEHAFDWFILRDGRYEPLAPDEQNMHHSEIFPGLDLNVAAMLEGDLAAVFETVRRGCDTDAHAAFVKRIASK